MFAANLKFFQGLYAIIQLSGAQTAPEPVSLILAAASHQCFMLMHESIMTFGRLLGNSAEPLARLDAMHGHRDVVSSMWAGAWLGGQCWGQVMMSASSTTSQAGAA